MAEDVSAPLPVSPASEAEPAPAGAALAGAPVPPAGFARLLSRRRERALFGQKVQHLIPAIPLLFAGVAALRHGAHGWALVLAVAEIVTSVLLIRSLVAEVRASRRPLPAAGEAAHHHGPDWGEVTAAAVIALEVFERWHETHHWSRPLILTAVITLAAGLAHGRLAAWAQRRRGLHLDAEGLRLGKRFKRTFAARWTELAAVDLGERYAEISTHDGRRHRLDLADLRNRDEVASLLGAAAHHLAALRALPSAGDAG